MSEERKFEVLPGVELPDLSAIKSAAADFSTSGMEDFQVKTHKHRIMPDGKPDAATSAELAQLQQLGNEVAADEERQAAESRARMDAILSSAVSAPSSLSSLRKENAGKMSDEQRQAIEDEEKAAKEAKEAEEAKIKAREERRLLQQRLLEEARERAAKEREEAEASSEVAEDETVEETEELVEEPSIASDDETVEDFSEFLDDDNI